MNTTNLEKYSLELINNRLKDNTLNLVIDVVEDFLEQTPIDRPQELENIISKINNFILDLAPQLNNPLDERQDYINSLSELKADLVAFSSPIFTYITQLNQTASFIVRDYKKLQIDSLDKFHVDRALFMSDIEEFIQKDSTDFVNHFNMSRLISKFPLRMTKAKFGDYVKASFPLMFEGLSDIFVINSVELLKQKLIPSIAPNFGTQYSFINDEINKFSKIDTTDYTVEQFDDLMDEIDTLYDTIETITSSLGVYYNRLNYLLNVISFSVDEDYLFEDNYTIKDMYFAMCDMIKSNGNEALSEQILDTTVELIENLYEKSTEIAKEYDKELSKISEDDYNQLPEDILTIINTHAIIESNYYREITDEFSNQFYQSDNQELASLELINQKADEFNVFIEEQLNGMPINKQKLIKQLFLENIPCPYTKEEFLDYIDYVFDSLGTSVTGYLTYLDVFNFYESENFKPYRPSDEHEHEHDENCGCGHHHDHHHHHHHDGNCNHHH